MKKHFILLLLLSLATGLSAQSRDTINDDTLRYIWQQYGYSRPYPKGYVSRVSSDVYNNTHYSYCFEAADQFVVDKPTYIYGVALRAHRRPRVGGFDYSLQETYVRLYQQNSDIYDQTLIDTVSVQYDVLADNERYPIYFTYYDTSHVWTDSLVQFYFKEPRLVHDSFVVFVTTLPHSYHYSKLGMNPVVNNASPKDRVGLLHIPHTGADPDNTANWAFTRNRGYTKAYNIFPIVLPPEIKWSERAEPQSPWVHSMSVTERKVIVKNLPNPGPGRQEIAYGPLYSNPDSVTHKTVNPEMLATSLRDLDTGVYYCAWLRNQIAQRYSYPKDTIYWSNWSAPLIFYLGTEPDTTGTGSDTTSTDTTGISLPHVPAFTLSPNPTTGDVTVEVADWTPDITLELLDLQGRQLRSYQKSESSGQTNQRTGIWTLDLSSLPKGTYLLRLTTPQGTTTQRLVKQ